MQLPDSFTSRTQEILQHEFPDFLRAMGGVVPTSVRVNNKISFVPSGEEVAWCDSGYYLAERPLFTADPYLHAGVYYVQEASSMFLQQVLEQFVSKKDVVLDLSAAPGGKSMLISQFLDSEGFLVSNDIVRSRANILAENLIKWGNSNIFVGNNTPKDFQRLPSFFDVLVVDAPCSGEGMFRKDAGAIAEWSEQNVRMCSIRQKDILRDVWHTLKTDGILIYSTCTFNREENEENVKWIEETLGAECLTINTKNFPEIAVTDKGLRFYPHKTKGEGFFISALRKTAQSPTPKRKPKNKPNIKIDSAVLSLRNQLKEPGRWEIVSENSIVSAVDKIHTEKVELLRNHLKTMHFGITLAEQKGKDFIPDISLALSKYLNEAVIRTVEVEIDIAIKYLQKEAIILPNIEKGYILLKYQSVPIGWVKNVGNRCNNLYPNEWRIRIRL
ncbi:MAG: methyltransferase RsmF C-terminal domain-like protein [Paludibacteraceae bacterium]